MTMGRCMFAGVKNGNPFRFKRVTFMVRRIIQDIRARICWIKPDNSLVMEFSGFVFEVKDVCLHLYVTRFMTLFITYI